jgi:hypothetical protein
MWKLFNKNEYITQGTRHRGALHLYSSLVFTKHIQSTMFPFTTTLRGRNGYVQALTSSVQ